MCFSEIKRETSVFIFKTSRMKTRECKNANLDENTRNCLLNLPLVFPNQVSAAQAHYSPISDFFCRKLSIDFSGQILVLDGNLLRTSVVKN